MKKIFLSIETSLNRIYLVLYSKTKFFSEEKKIESSIEVEINKMLKDLFLKSNLNYADLDFVAISLGPGSYTGTRVGLATAKAISTNSRTVCISPVATAMNFSPSGATGRSHCP